MGWYDAVSFSAWSIFFGSIWTSIFSDVGIGQPMNVTANYSRPANLDDAVVVQRVGLLLAGRFLTGMGIGGMYPCAAILSLNFGPWGSVAERCVVEVAMRARLLCCISWRPCLRARDCL